MTAAPLSLTAPLSALLVDLGRAGAELAPHPDHADRLRHRPAVLPPDLSARLRTHRAALLGLLAGGYAPTDPDAAHVLAERLGVADEMRMPTHPGAPAWSIAVGESMDCSCLGATLGVQWGYGSIGERDSSGGEGERGNPLRDRQGCAGGPKPTVADAER